MERLRQEHFYKSNELASLLTQGHFQCNKLSLLKTMLSQGIDDAQNLKYIKT